jgi:hypothetical protein
MKCDNMPGHSFFGDSLKTEPVSAENGSCHSGDAVGFRIDLKDLEGARRLHHLRFETERHAMVGITQLDRLVFRLGLKGSALHSWFAMLVKLKFVIDLVET